MNDNTTVDAGSAAALVGTNMHFGDLQGTRIAGLAVTLRVLGPALKRIQHHHLRAGIGVLSKCRYTPRSWELKKCAFRRSDKGTAFLLQGAVRGQLTNGNGPPEFTFHCHGGHLIGPPIDREIASRDDRQHE
jgi:hypothetical protein